MLVWLQALLRDERKRSGQELMARRSRALEAAALCRRWLRLKARGKLPISLVNALAANNRNRFLQSNTTEHDFEQRFCGGTLSARTFLANVLADFPNDRDLWWQQRGWFGVTFRLPLTLMSFANDAGAGR